MNCSVLNKIEKYFVKRAQFLIIKNSHWKFYRNNSSEIIYEIFNNNNSEFQLTENEKTLTINFINNLILFSLWDYTIFGKYEKTIIVLACILIVVSFSFQDFPIPQEIIEHNSNVMKNIIKNISFIDVNQVEKCTNEIIALMKKKDDVDDDENEDDEEEISISFNSLENFSSVKEAFKEIDDCSFFSTHYSFEENAINDNNNNNTDNNNNDNNNNTENNNVDFGKKEESFLLKKRKLI